MQFKAVVENHQASQAEVLFHLKEEQCKSTHKHKVGLDEEAVEPGRKLKEVFMEMKTMAEGLISGTQLTSIKNAVIHSICDDAPCLADYALPASCQ
jgi:hypothetical protein